MTRPRVLLLCGGRSEEHEVSISSARSVLQALEAGFEATPLVIDKGGRLLSPHASARALAAGSAEAGEGDLELVGLVAGEASSGSGEFDVVFPLLHGPNGEDGSVQGFLRLMGLPFVGSDVLGSAVGMDKLMMKSVFRAAGLPQVRYRGLARATWRSDGEASLRNLDLAFPLFVKPANLGSSVGISKAANFDELRGAVADAFEHDRRVIIEEGLAGARELEVGVLGNDALEVSPVGEIDFASEFYDYQSKYGEGLATLAIPARVPDEVAERCRSMAHRAFLAIDAAGLARVDFFYLEDEDKLLVNEINTMPGFTVTSMFPKLWEAGGLSYSKLVQRLVELALEHR